MNTPHPKPIGSTPYDDMHGVSALMARKSRVPIPISSMGPRRNNPTGLFGGRFRSFLTILKRG